MTDRVFQRSARLARYAAARMGRPALDRQTEDFLRAVREAGGLSSRTGVPVVAFLWPNPSYLRPSTQFAALTDLFERECNAAGIKVVDVAPLLARFPADRIRVSRFDDHPNAFGHRVLAEALAETLRREFAPGLRASHAAGATAAREPPCA